MSNEFALKFRPFDKVERCFDIVASVDRALGRYVVNFVTVGHRELRIRYQRKHGEQRR